MPDGSPIPELTVAVADGARGQGIGSGLIEALASQATPHLSRLALNVHLRNPAARLYMRAGFRVAGKEETGMVWRSDDPREPEVRDPGRTGSPAATDAEQSEIPDMRDDFRQRRRS